MNSDRAINEGKSLIKQCIGQVRAGKSTLIQKWSEKASLSRDLPIEQIGRTKATPLPGAFRVLGNGAVVGQ